MGKRSLCNWAMLLVLAALGFLSLYLALNRIYQVDEAQNIFMARVIGSRLTAEYFANPLLWLMGPMAWLARGADSAVALFTWNRLIFLLVFWINLVLMVKCAGESLRSRRGVLVLLMAATLAPLWDYGFEVRHDNLILTSLLLMWYLGRVRHLGRLSYFVLGFLTLLMKFMAFKALVYVLPLSLAFLCFPHPGHGRRRFELILAWVFGAIIGWGICWIIYKNAGIFQPDSAGSGSSIQAVGAVNGFAPWSLTLMRLPGQTPLLLAASVAALWCMGKGLLKKQWSFLSWDDYAPECFLVIGALLILFVNPTPFPYNLVNLVPFVFLLCVRYLNTLLFLLAEKAALRTLLYAVIVFTYVMPFVLATYRHFSMGNQRQQLLMYTAEYLTDPGKDPVYDAIGMVPTRQSIHYYWYLHSLNIKSFTNGGSMSVERMLEARPAAVFIPSYRTGWLPESDWKFIRSRYLPLADDFWVLGHVFPLGGGLWKVFHSGRYQVLGKKDSIVSPLRSFFIDGNKITSSIVDLSIGAHELKCGAEEQAVLVWLGPRAECVPSLSPGDSRSLFVNWY